MLQATRLAILVKTDSTTGVLEYPVNIANFKNTYFEKHPRTAASDGSYILQRKLNKIIQELDWPFVSFEK